MYICGGNIGIIRYEVVILGKRDKQQHRETFVHFGSNS